MLDTTNISKEGRHNRQRSSISMVGPHICDQNNDVSDKGMDSQRAVIQIDANVDNQKSSAYPVENNMAE